MTTITFTGESHLIARPMKNGIKQIIGRIGRDGNSGHSPNWLAKPKSGRQNAPHWVRNPMIDLAQPSSRL